MRKKQNMCNGNGAGENWIRWKKCGILFLGILLYIFSSYSKMLVPGPVYNDLLKELSFNPSQIASLGAVYMYAYAASQLIGGIYSDRYGGVWILLIGGSLLTVGLAAFPLLSDLLLMQIVRGTAGLGTGMVFLSVAKLVVDLYPQRFSMMLGVVLFCGYIGVTSGTFPTVWEIDRHGW